MPHLIPTTRPRARVFTALAVTAALVAAGAPVAPAASAADPAPVAIAAANPYERGPAPTRASIEASRGSYAVSSTVVSRSSATGFGGGTIYYPTSTTDGTFGAIAVSPGYTGPQFSIAWYGPRIASQGFVVITIDTLTLQDNPASRGTQLLAALDYLTDKSTVRNRIDATRLGVMGHSMGGGGSLAASRTRSVPQTDPIPRAALQAAIPLTPYHTVTDWTRDAVPTLIIGAENDSTAPVATYAKPFYTSLPSTLDKAYLELNNAGHTAPISSNVTIAKYSIAWLKRFIDNDTRYDQFLCPAPSGSTIQEYRSTCPYS